MSAGWRTPLQYVGLEAALAQDVRGGGAAPAGVAAQDVRNILRDRIEFQTDEIQRDIERVLDAKVLKLAGEPHVEPLAAAGDDLLGLVVIDPLEQGLVEQGLKVLLAEAHERAVGEHGDGGIALCLGDQ